MAATALAEKYQALGFRVIEGGKSSKLVILNTPAVAEIFGMRHVDVLRAKERQEEKINASGRSSFAEHCIPAQYKDSQNRQQDCFNLTKLGFLHIAARWDDVLRWLLVLAFDALEHGSESGQLISQINGRIRELRSGASGQNELILEPPQLELRDANQRHLEAICEIGHSVNYDRDANHEPRSKWSWSTWQERPPYLTCRHPVTHQHVAFMEWPLEAKQLWRLRTNYNTLPPSSELWREIAALLIDD